MTKTKDTPTRRGLLAGGAGIVAAAIPAGAAMAGSTEDAQFLEWERQANYWYGLSGRKGHTDEELDAEIDQFRHYEGLILRTPGHSVVAARVKVTVLVRDAVNFKEEPYIAPLQSVLATLEAVAR